MASCRVTLEIRLVSGILECDCCGNWLHFLLPPDAIESLAQVDCPRCRASLDLWEDSIWCAVVMSPDAPVKRPYLEPRLPSSVPKHPRPEAS